MPKITAIILSAGKGSRMGADIPKQYIKINDKPIIAYALEAFQKSIADEIVIVCAGEDAAFAKAITDVYGICKTVSIVPGGKERYDSVLSGLRAVSRDCDIVLIHDGARPFISAEGIRDVAVAAEEYGAAIAGVPVKDTIKIADADGFVKETTVRADTWQIQTPQGFRYDLILEAYEKVVGNEESRKDNAGITDDAMVFEKAFPDKKVKLVNTGYENFKITTPDDLMAAKLRLSAD